MLLMEIIDSLLTYDTEHTEHMGTDTMLANTGTLNDKMFTTDRTSKKVRISLLKD